MPFELPLPQDLKQRGWRVKIRDKERLEPPHVTLLRGNQSWRIDLRTGTFMDGDPAPRDVPKGLLDHIKSKGHWAALRGEWDRRYPTNKVEGDPDGDQD